MQRKSQKNAKKPESFGKISASGPWSTTHNHEIFVVRNDSDNGLLVFAPRNALEVSAYCEVIIGDRTFKTSALPYQQLYVSFGVKDRNFPLVFAFLNGKSTIIYRRFLNIILKRMRKLQVNCKINTIVTDYERGLVSAIETAYPQWKHFGCFFHFTKASYSKV